LQRTPFDLLSTNLKKARAESLKNTIKNCYPEKWTTPEFTNSQQIDLCRKIESDKTMGEFTSLHEKMVESVQVEFYKCIENFPKHRMGGL